MYIYINKYIYIYICIHIIVYINTYKYIQAYNTERVKVAHFNVNKAAIVITVRQQNSFPLY